MNPSRKQYQVVAEWVGGGCITFGNPVDSLDVAKGILKRYAEWGLGLVKGAWIEVRSVSEWEKA